MGNRIHRAIAIIGVLGVVTLAGCTGGDPNPTPSASTSAAPAPSPSPSPSSTPSPSTPAVAKPERPAEMDRTDSVGAGAAATYFVALYPYVLSTGDTSDWVAMSSPACKFCSGISADALDVRDRKVSYNGGAIQLSGLQVLPPDESAGGYPVEAQFAQKPETRRDSSGTILSETTGDSGRVRIETINLDGDWEILAVIVSDI